VGQVTDVLYEDCTILCLDFWRGQPVELDVPRELVIQVIEKAPEGTELPRRARRVMSQEAWSCWASLAIEG